MGSEGKVDLGTIKVHQNVIADICVSAIQEVDGVRLAPNDSLSLNQVLGFLGLKKNTGVEVVVDARNQVSVVVKVVLRYGMSLSDTSRKVQDVIMTAVEKMADVNLKDVDVNIQGIERGEA